MSRHFSSGRLVLPGTGLLPSGSLAAPATLAPLFLLPTAHASTLPSGSGSFTATGEVISVRHAGGNTIVVATEVQVLTGVLDGIRRAEGTEIFHPDGTFTAEVTYSAQLHLDS